MSQVGGLRSQVAGYPAQAGSSRMPMASAAPGRAPMNSGSQWMPGVNRPLMGTVANPPVVAHNVAYGPSYNFEYQPRSTADKTAVKYTGYLPLEGVYEEDNCRVG
mmetsp:Transcript_1869/g.3663  ORF Transcript_1869/g.3663 Transcript_1869/m.3663 type:complete len:105 (+) Transcript_1869:119-433(+)